MTHKKKLKKLIRDRKAETGESYSTARVQVLRQRAALLGDKPPIEGAVLKVNLQSARIQIFGEPGQVTFRSRDIYDVVPGHVVTLEIKRRWSRGGNDYASGRIKNARIDVAKLGLDPLPLKEFWLADLASETEPFRDPDPYAPLWRKLTAKPRMCFDFDPIAWGAFPGWDLDDNPTCNAAELAGRGDVEGARDLLMKALCEDLRCIDAHAHLGNLEFDLWPERAMIHYEMGIRIAALSLPPEFDGFLLWGRIYNRPLLRCYHGYGLCLWRLGRFDEAQAIFERMLSLNPTDNQGVRCCWLDVREGRSWDEVHGSEDMDPTTSPPG